MEYLRHLLFVTTKAGDIVALGFDENGSSALAIATSQGSTFLYSVHELQRSTATRPDGA